LSKAGVGLRGESAGAVVAVKQRRRRTKWTTETYREEVRRLTEGEYSVSGEYIYAKAKMLHLHVVCGHEWLIIPNNFLRGARCPKCAGNSRKDTDAYKAEVFELVGTEYSVSGEYINAKAKMLHLHVVCGHECIIRPSHFLRGVRCPKCAGNSRKDTDAYKAEVFELVGTEYSVSGEYINTNAKMLHLHVVCGHEWLIRPSDFLQGVRCPKCNESKGERRVSDVLASYSVYFIREHPFEDCRNINPLPFDHAVYSGDNLACLIEFDGIQHSEPSEYFGGEEAFEQRQLHDAIKTEYCRANDIPLIRIKYTEFDEIETILTAKLTDLGVIGKRLTTDSAEQTDTLAS
jgi:peptide methionine sulfoxide reductase MsrB